MKLGTLFSLTACLALAGTAALAGWKSNYACTFTQECVGTDRPCAKGDPLVATLSRQGPVWILAGESDSKIAFREISRLDAPMLSLISTQSDPAASAATLLSVAKDGTAYVSTHGIFLEPGSVLHVGTCAAEGN